MAARLEMKEEEMEKKQHSFFNGRDNYALCDVTKGP